MHEFYEYTPVAKKQQAAQKALEKLQKKQPDVRPIVITGNKIAKTWWGNAWNKNLEAYADFSNRITRGRSYVRNGFVLDLQIDTGHVNAIVAGSRRTPYEVQISITALAEDRWKAITEICGRSIAGIEQLAQGKFPKELETLFIQQGQGLFPTPDEIQFSCSCPDWANMCKHVAAVLYGIGARFDEDPTLFFKLRNIEIEALIKKSVEEKMENMLKNVGRKTHRVMDDAAITDLFGL
ncbi:SWIM zinc finger family protein [Lysinibacillus sp. FSL H8-0500]|uniref:SWIM zinc finger family protein n=1 Tax=Lysinibacillus sp. FSL H8-0500 TaxID=2921393 RepID=UPI003100F85D